MHGHAHGHGHGSSSAGRVLYLSLVLTSGFMFVEAAVGWYTGSLALLADAGHMLGDSGALALAVLAQRFAQRQRTHQATFGFRRAEVLAAFLNGVALAAISVWICVEAVGRWWSPVELRTTGLLETASLGLGVNLLVAWLLSRGSHDSVNVRAALMHVLLDVLGSVSAISAAVMVRFFGLTGADAVLSLAIAALVSISGYRIAKETALVLLESAPEELDAKVVAETIDGTEGVSSHHDLHLWRISDGFDVLSVHVVLQSGHHGVDVCRRVAQRIESEHGLDHVTVQPEAPPPEPIVQLGLRPRVEGACSD